MLCNTTLLNLAIHQVIFHAEKIILTCFEVMAPTWQVCHRQLEILVEFVEAHRTITLENAGKGPLGQQEANKAWEKLARRLNCIGGGVIKTHQIGSE